jgi:hypothetical protein
VPLRGLGLDDGLGLQRALLITSTDPNWDRNAWWSPLLTVFGQRRHPRKLQKRRPSTMMMTQHDLSQIQNW